MVDTGFNGYLALPSALIATLQLEWLCRQDGTLADGRTEVFDVFAATILWDGQPRKVEVDAVNGAPLVGMALLERHKLDIEVLAGGKVVIQMLS